MLERRHQTPGGTPDSIPRDTEEGRAFLQARVARFAKIATIFLGVLVPVGVGYRSYTPIEHGIAGLPSGFGLATVGHTSLVLALFLAWLVTRKGRRSRVLLDVVDATLSMVVATAFGLAGLGVQPWVRPDLVALFVTTLVLAMRAVFIPGTATRAAIISG